AERALALRPDFAEAWQARDCGRIYTQLGQLDKALNAYDRALALNEDVKYAKGDRLYVKLQLSDWTNLDAEISDVIASVRTLQTPTAPVEFLAVSSSPEDQLQATKRCIANLTSLPAVWRGEIYAHDRIRVGYFSADFRDHPVAQLTAGMFEAHDKSRFETIALSLGPDDGSDLRRRIRSAFDDFADVRNLSDGDLAALIRRREIDILVDLTGFTHGGRFGVLARRIAPIQVNFPGYPGTTGADCVDYIIADPTVIPEDHFPYYSERVVWLPDSYQANDDKNPIPEGVPSRSECGLPETGFLFCCFNNTYKISPQIFDVWMRLLAATANSVLWLLGTNPTAAQNLRRGAERRGIAADRLIFAPRIAVGEGGFNLL
ncbi:MAG: tetratricopeptide repeat protein, partial [Xanthobacteraceae bacterium]